MTTEELWRALFEIRAQATRHKRAVSLKTYLLHDLEVIERRATELLNKLKTPNGDEASDA